MGKGKAATDENQGGVKIFIILLHIFCVKFCRLPFVHGVEIVPWVTVLDWLEVRPEGLLDAIENQPISRETRPPKRTLEDRR